MESLGWTLTFQTSVLQVCLWALLRMSCFHLNRPPCPQQRARRGLSATAVFQLSMELLNCFKCGFSVCSWNSTSEHLESALSTFNIPRHVYSWLSPIIFSNSVLEITRASNFWSKTFVPRPCYSQLCPEVEVEIMVGNLTLMSNQPMFRSQL